MSAPTIIYQPPSSNKATASLILGIVGVIAALGQCCCCLALPVAGICSVLAWVLGQSELSAIRRGECAETGRGLAQAGMILGIVGTVLVVLYLIVFFIYWIVMGTAAMKDAMRNGPVFHR
jgi:hypothetical protein